MKPDQSDFVNVVSINEEYSEVKVEWKQMYEADKSLFDELGRYRLTVQAFESNGPPSKPKALILDTTSGEWNQTEMWGEENCNEPQKSAEVRQVGTVRPGASSSPSTPDGQGTL